MSASITSGTYPRASRSSFSGRAAPLRQSALKVWGFLLELGAQRARRHLFRLADHYQITDPALASSLRESARHAGEH
jgi:hypothetical protein